MANVLEVVMVPNGWKLVEAKDVCESISVGVVIKPTQYYVEESEGVKAFRSANVREGFINDHDWVYFSHEGHAANKKSQLKAGDILIVRTGYPGTACVVTPEFEGSNAIDIVIARPDREQIISEYLCAYTNSHMGKSQVLDLQGGMAQKHLNVGAYQVLKIKLPPLPEQKKIAQILSTWDKAITTTEQLLANSQQQKKALMQQLLTGKKRLLDKNGVRFSGEWASYLLEELEELGWIELGRGNVISKKDIDNIPGDYPIYSSSVKNNGLMGKYGEYMFDEELISWSVDGGGNFFYRPKHKFSVTNVSGYMRLNAENLNCQFIAAQLELHHSRLEFDYQSKAHPSVIRKVYTLTVPCLKEQSKIAAVLSTADQEISTLQQKLDALKQEKKALMQQLLTGKCRVQIN
ncbi:restriction endonuclease subunit S [Gallaecimonas sp. GXIMD1310]|uniref:restriction endonuclease subunit S n=1 Tax=Gallaecimonas sp. GXIMD1310 TaxID=3131926 RepID=UPI003252723D